MAKKPPTQAELACTVSWTGPTVSWIDQADPIQLVLPGRGWTSIEWNSVKDEVPTVAEPFDAATPLTNADDINGGLVVAQQSQSTSLGTTAFRAEQAGATAVLIVNDDQDLPAPRTFAPGDDGAKVTIPVYMVNQEDGMRLVNALKATPLTYVSIKRKFPSLSSIVPRSLLLSLALFYCHRFPNKLSPSFPSASLRPGHALIRPVYPVPFGALFVT
jgi:hypothetical protein